LKKRGWQVRFVDPHVEIDHARSLGAADEKAQELAGDLVIIATSVDVAMDLEPKGKVATTTCSVMAPFVRDGFVAGHPFAGSEKNGLNNARADLFNGHPWFVNRHDDSVCAMIEAVGAREVVVEPREHDQAMALTSHLPQMISTALASLVEQKHVNPVFIGSGLRTLLRLAASSYEVWGSVLDANARNIGQAERELLRVMNQMTSEDFNRARRFMAKYNEPH
ncbi:MAG TPA: prephenate dehydrogenase/arogenate dehydrogenase family protein, partial [Thermoanaerobaculia bacterium]